MITMCDITPFKNRELDLTKKVEIYRCLTRSGYVYSVWQKGKVVGHTSGVVLKDVTFKISKSGKQRAIDTGIRNVHARISGYIDCTLKDTEPVGKLKYYPFCKDNFMCNGNEINTCEVVTIMEGELTVDKYVNRYE